MNSLKISAISFLFLVVACASDPGSTDELVPVANTTAIHMAPLRGVGQVSKVAPPGAHLTYFGGPVITTISVHPLFWNSRVNFIQRIIDMYLGVPASLLFDMLKQYGVGRGAGDSGVIDTRATQNISDATVRTEVLNQINAGRLPAPTVNTYYPVHFPPNMSITAPDGSRSCVVFCAYHGTFQVQNGAGTTFNINYGVIPDQGSSGCASGCGANTTVNNLTSVASHELVEAATDPAVGLATTVGPPLAWYDPNNGEIGDICNGQQGTTVGADGETYVVQLEFSNAANNCVAQ